MKRALLRGAVHLRSPAPVPIGGAAGAVGVHRAQRKPHPEARPGPVVTLLRKPLLSIPATASTSATPASVPQASTPTSNVTVAEQTRAVGSSNSQFTPPPASISPCDMLVPPQLLLRPGSGSGPGLGRKPRATRLARLTPSQLETFHVNAWAQLDAALASYDSRPAYLRQRQRELELAQAHDSPADNQIGDNIPTDPISPARLPRSARRLSPSHITSLLLAAHTVHIAPNPSTSLSAQRSRSALYTELVAHITAHPHSGATTRLLDLLARRAREGLPPDARLVSRVLKYALDAASRGDARGLRLGLVQRLMEYMPESPDAVLLAQVMRVVVDETSIEAGEVREVIEKCVRLMRAREGGFEAGMEGEPDQDVLSGEGKGKGKEKAEDGQSADLPPAGGDMATWEWGLWDTYLAAFRRGGDWRGTMGVLKEFTEVVQAHRAAREAVPSSSSATWAWTQAEREAIARPFISALTVFTVTTVSSAHRREARRLSRIPEAVVAAYMGLVRGHEGMEEEKGVERDEEADGREVLDSGPMWNAWMNAERVVGNLDTAEAVWEEVMGVAGQVPRASLQEGESYLSDKVSLPYRAPTPRASDNNGGSGFIHDASTYITLFRLLKTRSRGISPALLQRFLDEPTRADTGGGKCEDIVTAASLNAALSCVFGVDTTAYHPSDNTSDDPLSPSTRLAHARALLARYSHAHPPEARTINIVGAGLIKLWRAGLPLWGDSERKRIPLPRGHGGEREHVRDLRVRMRAQSGVEDVLRGARLRARAGLELVGAGAGADAELWVGRDEWELVSQEIGQRVRVQDGVREDEGEVEMPFGKPVGRLMRAPTSEQTDAAGRGQSTEVEANVDRGVQASESEPESVGDEWSAQYELDEAGVLEGRDPGLERTWRVYEALRGMVDSALEVALHERSSR